MDARTPSLRSIPRVAPSLGAMLGRALDLTQSVASDELRLLQLESQERAGDIARRAAWVGFGAVCLLLAWLALSAAAVVALEGRLPLEARLGLLALLQALFGGGLVAFGLRERGARL